MSNLIDSLPKTRGSYRADAMLAKTNWFGVGGPAEVLFRPEDESDLSLFLSELESDIPYRVIGVGSNLLIRDGGIEGVVVKLGRGFTEIALNGLELQVGAACLNYNVANFCKDHGLTGLEFLVGIPGSIGGGVAMNAGAYGCDFSAVCSKVKVIDEHGQIHVLSASELGFVYRGNTLPEGMVITQAVFSVKRAESAFITARMAEISAKREQTQPIKSKTSGSTFTNPAGFRAWELIDKAGCRGLVHGDAAVSELHCNFLINLGNATAADIEELGEMIRKRVKNNSGVELEWEIKIIGKK